MHSKNFPVYGSEAQLYRTRLKNSIGAGYFPFSKRLEITIPLHNSEQESWYD